MLAALALWFDDVLAGGAAELRGPFGWISVIFLFFAPAITMRSLAEERRSGSLHLLSTLPLRPSEVVLGKWLAAVVMIGAALASTAGYPVALSLLGPLDWGPVLGGYLGLWLLGGALSAIGLLCSALTDSQVLAFLGAVALSLGPWGLGRALPLVPAGLAPLVEALTFDAHVSALARGVLDSRDLVFFAAVTAVALRATVLVLEHRRLAA